MSRINHIFGPVPSRRLGKSLGIDIVPYKVCSFDCIYCQLGRTTHKSIEQKEYFPLHEIFADIDAKFKENCNFDYVTLSGSGEPTLHSGIGEIINKIKSLSKKPIAVLTNGSLLWKAEIRRALMKADLVVPSLDAGNEEMFGYINRPSKELNFNIVVSGIKEFISEFKGKIWLEVFLLKGFSSDIKHIKQLSKLVEYLGPSKTQLNTIARPPAEDYAIGLSSEQLNNFCKYFPGKVESIGEFKDSDNEKTSKVKKDEILNMLARRSCTAKDISESLLVNLNEVLKLLEALCRDGTLISDKIKDKIFYKLKKKQN